MDSGLVRRGYYRNAALRSPEACDSGLRQRAACLVRKACRRVHEAGEGNEREGAGKRRRIRHDV